MPLREIGRREFSGEPEIRMLHEREIMVGERRQRAVAPRDVAFATMKFIRDRIYIITERRVPAESLHHQFIGTVCALKIVPNLLLVVQKIFSEIGSDGPPLRPFLYCQGITGIFK